MSRLISLFDLDPASYAAHPIHSDERTYSETNCYVDCLVELVHAAGLEADAMMGGAVAADFELDQWTFFKPTPGRPVPALRHRPARGAALPRLPDADRDPARGRPDGDARGRLVLPARRRGDGLPHRPREVDDHRGVDRRGRQGAALLPQHRLPRALRRGLRQAVRDLLRRRPPADVRRAAPPRRRARSRPATSCRPWPASCSPATWRGGRPRTRSPASPPSSRPTCPR